MLRVAWVLLLATGLGSAGCNRPRWDTPQAAYESFLRALEKGDEEIAYGALSTKTRELLSQRAKEISRASGGAVKDDPSALFFSGGGRSGAKQRVANVRQTGDRAVIEVELGAPGSGKKQDVEMVKEPDGWRIAIADAGGSQAAGSAAGPPQQDESKDAGQ